MTDEELTEHLSERYPSKYSENHSSIKPDLIEDYGRRVDVICFQIIPWKLIR